MASMRQMSQRPSSSQFLTGGRKPVHVCTQGEEKCELNTHTHTACVLCSTLLSCTHTHKHTWTHSLTHETTHPPPSHPSLAIISGPCTPSAAPPASLPWHGRGGASEPVPARDPPVPVLRQQPGCVRQECGCKRLCVQAVGGLRALERGF